MYHGASWFALFIPQHELCGSSPQEGYCPKFTNEDVNSDDPRSESAAEKYRVSLTSSQQAWNLSGWAGGTGVNRELMRVEGKKYNEIK